MEISYICFWVTIESNTQAQSQTTPYTLPLHTTPPFARRVRHIKCCSKPTSVERCGGGVGYQALKQRVCIGADLRLVST